MAEDSVPAFPEDTDSFLDDIPESANTAPYVTTFAALAQLLVPVIGGVIAQVATGIDQHYNQQRNERLFRRFGKLVGDLEESALKKDYLKSPEGYDIFITAVDMNHRTRSEAKCDLIARILRGALVDFDRGRYSPEEYLNMLEPLTTKETPDSARGTQPDTK